MLNPATVDLDHVVFNYDLSNYASTSFRKQWTGIQDAPLTGLARYDRRFEKMNMLAGVSLLADKTGPTSLSGGQLRYAYQFPVGAGAFSIGVGAGYFQSRYNGDESLLRDANDAVGLEDRNRQFVDFSAGIFYYNELAYNDILYFGVSMPQTAGIHVAPDGSPDYTNYRAKHFHARIGYYKFLEGLAQDGEVSFLEPSFSVNGAANTPFKITGNLRFQLAGLMWVGGGYSVSAGGGTFNQDDMRLEAGFLIGGQGYAEKLFKIGYAYERSLTKYNVQLDGTHEVNLSYSF